MPSRKGDARQSDASVSRLISAEDDSQTSPDTTAAAPSGPITVDTNLAALPSSTQPQPPPPPPQEKKDKEKDSKDAVTLEDLSLPKSIITRLAKGVLPPNTQIQANAILALSKSATVFISHLASVANEMTQESNKKTIMPADVFSALEKTEYGFMRETLEAEFAKFNEVQTSKRSTYRKKVAAAKKATTADSSMLSTTSTAADISEDLLTAAADAVASAPPAAKKARVDPAPGGDGSRMDVEGDVGDGEVSDAETVPDESAEEEEEDEEDEDEDEEEEADEENDEDGEKGNGESDDPEQRHPRESGDEALDDEDSE